MLDVTNQFNFINNNQAFVMIFAEYWETAFVGIYGICLKVYGKGL